MLTSKKHTVPLYGGTFTVIIYDKDAEFEERFKKCTFNHPISTWDGGLFVRDGLTYMVLSAEKKGYPTPGIIAHESKHLVNNIFQDIGQELDSRNDEAECYLLGWIVNRVHEVLIKHNKSKAL